MINRVIGIIYPYKTKKERLEIYKKILNMIADGSENYLCIAASKVCKLSTSEIHRLPELYAFKPLDKGYFTPWWKKDKKKRIEVMLKIIKSMEPTFVFKQRTGT